MLTLPILLLRNRHNRMQNQHKSSTFLALDPRGGAQEQQVSIVAAANAGKHLAQAVQML